MGFSKAKTTLSDSLILLGFSLLSFSTIRSVYFLLFLGSFVIGDIFASLYKEYNLEKRKIDNKMENAILLLIGLIVVVISTKNLLSNLVEDYEDPELCPSGVVNYIWNNYEEEQIKDMRIYNGFNFGSYMEFNGLPVFMDSRAEIYLSTFNDTSIIEDFLSISPGKIHYNDTFEKYDINYVLVEKDSIFKNYIYEDKYWNLLYQDNYFSFYEKVEE